VGIGRAGELPFRTAESRRESGLVVDVRKREDRTRRRETRVAGGRHHDEGELAFPTHAAVAVSAPVEAVRGRDALEREGYRAVRNEQSRERVGPSSRRDTRPGMTGETHTTARGLPSDVYRAILPNGQLEAEEYEHVEDGVELYDEDHELLAFVPYANLEALLTEAAYERDDPDVM